MNRLITFFLMTVLLILVSCIDPEMNEPGMPPDMVEPDDNTLPPPEVLPAIEIIGAERGTFTVVIPSPLPGASPMTATVDFSHRIKVQIKNRDISALLFETDQSDFRFATANALFFGNFNLISVTPNAITAGTEIFVYPENKSASASVSNFTVTKSEITFINDSGIETNIINIENTMFSNL